MDLLKCFLNLNHFMKELWPEKNKKVSSNNHLIVHRSRVPKMDRIHSIA